MRKFSAMSPTKGKIFSEKGKAALLEKIQKDLPEKWIVQFSKKHDSRVYFFNKADGTRTWEHPGFSLGSNNDKEIIKKTGLKRKSDETKNTIGSTGLPQSSKLDKKSGEPKKRKSVEKAESFSSRSPIPQKSPKLLQTHSTSVVKRKKKKKRISKILNNNNVHKALNNSCTSDVSYHKVCDKRKSVDINEPCTSTDVQHQSQLLNSRAAIVNDVEMTDVEATSTIQEPDSTSHMNITTEDFCKNKKEKLIILIIDTNVLLHTNYQCDLERLVQSKRRKKNMQPKLECIIPWVVLQELDHLKQKKPLARVAIRFLNRHFQVQESAIRGQTIFEAATVIERLHIENNDDRILQCCFFVMQSSDNNNIPVLWTLDKNLMNKALTNNIKCFGDVADILKLSMSTPIEKEYEAQLGVSKQEIFDKNNNTVQKRFQKHTILSGEEISAIYDESILRIKLSLTYILEKEMKEAFDDLWLDVVLKKPPWSLKDVLQCIRKHWLAVFKLIGVDHIIKVHVDMLIELLGSFRPEMAEDSSFVTKWSASGVGLIAGINQCGKYNNPVKDDLVTLRNLHKSLMTGCKTEIESSSKDKHKDTDEQVGCDVKSQLHQEDEISVEMVVVQETNSTEFWIALNKIWTSIISHCGMIFQSLGYVPSRIYDAPDVHQALLATFETIPEKALAAQALPLVIDLVESLQASFQKLLTLSGINTEYGASFGDLLQALWTTIQAFSVDCNVHRLFSLCHELGTSIMSSNEMINRIKAGSDQLEVVKDLLKECFSALSSNPNVIFT